MTPDIIVRDFMPADQLAARQLILEGLGGHFGFIDETMNPDLDDIAASYAGGAFIVGTVAGMIVGTGALKSAGETAVQVVRMSTSADHRRQGIGTAVLRCLMERASAMGCSSIVLGTDASWTDAVAFYAAAGFARVDDGTGPAIFKMDL